MKSHFVGQPAFRVAIGFLALACVAITASAQAPTAALAENSSAAPSPHASTTSWWKLASPPDLNYIIGSDDVIAVDVSPYFERFCRIGIRQSGISVDFAMILIVIRVGDLVIRCLRLRIDSGATAHWVGDKRLDRRMKNEFDAGDLIREVELRAGDDALIHDAR